MLKFQLPLFVLGFVFVNTSCTQRASETNVQMSQVEKPLTLVEKGKALIAAKGCVSCHTIDGTRLVGPSFKGIYDSQVELADGTTVKADSQYIRESIESPMTKIVKGYPSSMMSYRGVVSEEEISAITEFIKSLK